jgi:hypothetical protein
VAAAVHTYHHPQGLQMMSMTAETQTGNPYDAVADTIKSSFVPKIAS